MLALGSSCISPVQASQAEKPAIVLVAFGTSVAEARKVFDHIETRAKERFPGYDIRWAFTSQFIINKLKKQGIVSHSVAEVVNELRQLGVKQVVFQSLHVVPGQEYASVKKVDMTGLEVAYGDALLTSSADIDAVINALEPEILAQQATVIVAHGNDRHPQYNSQLHALADRMEPRYPNLVVASVEGTPGIEPLQKVRAMCRQTGTVRFVPLMIVAGDHIMNDVMGDSVDSWKSIVAAETTECARSLGWNNDVLEIYFSHLKHALEQLQKG